jgi:hypothetical protein
VLVAAAAVSVVIACGGAPAGVGPPPVLAAGGPPLPPPPVGDADARGAAYLAAVAAQIQPAWGQFLEDCRLRLPPTHPLNAPGLVAVAQLAIDRRGQLVRATLVQPSGLAEFDRVAAAVIADAAPLPRPPSALESDDELVHLRWVLARDRRQAGAATASVITVELPVRGVVERLIARGALTRAAHRLAESAAPPAEVLAAADLIMRAALGEGLASADGDVRRAAVEAVGRAEARELAPALASALAPEAPADLQRAAATAAAAIGEASAAAAIAATFPEHLAAQPRVALEQAAALVKLGRGDDVRAAIRRAVAAAAATPSPAAAATRATAVAALLLAPDPTLAPQVPRWLARGDARLRSAACAALPAGAPAVAADFIGRGLRDADAAVRAACATAAARAGRPVPPTTLWLLAELTRDRDAAARARAIAALIALELPRRVRGRPLADPAAEVRAAAAPLATEPELRALAADRDAEVRAAAIAHLATRSPAAAAEAAADPAAIVRRAAVAALGALAQRSTSPDAPGAAALDRLARDEAPDVALAAEIQRAALRGRAAITRALLSRIVAAPPGGHERVRIALAWLLAR